MYYEVVELETQENGLTYSLVNFWRNKAWHDAGNAPDITESFHSQVVSDGSRIITNRDGWFKRLSDGVFVDPETLDPEDKTEWERESFTVDVKSQLLGFWEEFWDRNEDRILAGSLPGDMSDRRVRLKPANERDSIITRSDVAALRGTKREGQVRALADSRGR